MKIEVIRQQKVITQRDEAYRGYGGKSPPTMKICHFTGQKTAVQCISAGQLADAGPFDQPLLQKKATGNISAGQAPSISRKNMLKLHP